MEEAIQIRKVLIADDEKDFVTFLSVALKKKGFDIITAFDGEEAKARIKEANLDIILLDLMMPRLNGWEVLRWIREKGISTPVIIISARNSFSDIKDVYNLDADYYMVKPVNVKDVIKGINAVSSLNMFKNL